MKLNVGLFSFTFQIFFALEGHLRTVVIVYLKTKKKKIKNIYNKIFSV